MSEKLERNNTVKRMDCTELKKKWMNCVAQQTPLPQKYEDCTPHWKNFIKCFVYRH